MPENGQQPSIEELYKRVREVARADVVISFGDPPNDPRPDFLAELLSDSIIARAESATITRVLLDRLGITPEEWLSCLSEELSAELEKLKS
jgi:hypothetical protein